MVRINVRSNKRRENDGLRAFKKDIWYGEVSNHTIETLKSNLRDGQQRKNALS